MAEPEGASYIFEADDVSDGFPVIAPTRSRVDALLEPLGVDPNEVIGDIAPRGATLTYEVAAANAVMTGCTPAQLWVVAETIKTMFDPGFNLASIQATTHPSGPCVIVSGPMAAEAGIHGGTGCFGPGFKANARIGRALRLIQLNVGGAWPGSGDMATFGTPAKWSFCFTDQAVQGKDGTYWPTLAEERAGRSDANVICVVPGEGPHNVNDHFSTTADGVLRTMSSCLANVGTNDAHQENSTPLLVCGPEHALIIASEGFTRDDVRNYLAMHSRIPLTNWSPENRQARFRNRFPKLYGKVEDWQEIPVLQHAKDLVVAVAGGPGRHSMLVPSFGLCFAAFREADPIPAAAL